MLEGHYEMIWQKFYERCIREERARWHKGHGVVQDRAWYYGPLRVTTIFGGTVRTDVPTPYKTDLQIGPFAMHVFWRGDEDPDCHDHQMDFVTFPLVSYREEVLIFTEGDARRRLERRVVKAFRFHMRRAEYTHRVTGRADDKSLAAVHDVKRPIVTLVWRGRKRREWGFWRVSKDGYSWAFRPWKAYIAEKRAQ